MQQQLWAPLKPPPRIYYSREARPFGRIPSPRQRQYRGYGGAVDVFSTLYNRVTVCTAATGCLPPVDLNAPPDPETAKILGDIQPAVILDGPAGTKTIAPYGVPDGVSTAFKQAGLGVAVGIGAALVGAVLLIRSF